MELSVSNLAWDNKDNLKILKILKKYDIKHIEGVIPKISKWDDITDLKINDFKNLLKEYNISVPTIQSIFYGKNIDSLFDEQSFLTHIRLLIDLSKKLDYKIMVFGSPNLRKNSPFNDLSSIFKKVDVLLNNSGVILCIEPNSKIYGGEYFFTVSEIVNFIKKNNFNNIKTMIDTHNIILEGEDPIKVLSIYNEYIHHIHISENKLTPLSDFDFHKKFYNKIKELNYSGIVTYELLPCDNIENEIKIFNKIYK